MTHVMTARTEQIQFLVRAIPYLLIGLILTAPVEARPYAAPLSPLAQDEAVAESEPPQDDGATGETTEEPTIEAPDGNSDAESNESPAAAETDAVAENGVGEDKEEPGQIGRAHV